jgi:O-acetyl-ADP-ribose deacetylase (regulator of RNase III)
LVNVKPPHNPRGGGLFFAEGGLWIITLAGIAGFYPPTDEEGFLDFARQLSHPCLYEAIREAEPVTQIYGYRRTENQWRHYERLTRWPRGLLVIGDAVCCFNPVYGQGMTSAAMGASLLDEQLRKTKDPVSSDFGKTFQRQLAKFLETPWLVATGEDFRWENTEGDRPSRAARIVQSYMDRVIKLAMLDSHAHPAWTSGGLLPAKYVIHAVGPVWGDGDEDNKLNNAVTGSLRVADELHLNSIAMPAISTGIYGFPKDRAAGIIFSAFENYFIENSSSGLKIIRLVLFDQPTVDAFIDRCKMENGS